MKILYAAASGAALVLAFPPFGIYPLSFVAFVPLFVLLSPENKPKLAAPYLYLTFFIYCVGANWWISSWQEKTDPYLFASGIGLDLLHPFFFLVPIAIYLFIQKRLGVEKALWAFPFIWTAFEWSRAFTDIAYPWLSVGYGQIYHTYFVQIADIGGVWLIGFLIAVVNVLVAKLIFAYTKIRNSGGSLKDYVRNKKNVFFAATIAAIIILPNIYGAIRISDFDRETLLKNRKCVRIGVVQPNIDPWDKWSGGVISQIVLHQQITDSLINASGGLDLAVWSETAMPFLNFDFNTAKDLSLLERYVNYRQTALMTGYSYYRILNDNEKPDVTAKTYPRDTTKMMQAYNSALMLNPENYDLPPQIYRKARLTPFGERVPFIDLFSFAKEWFEWGVGISSWTRGERRFALKFLAGDDTVRLGSIICIESVFPNYCAGFVRDGAQILSVITNDAWYDHTYGPEQHYQIAAMRAIESRRYIARCANSGVSGFISPTGKSVSRAPQYKAVGLWETLPALDEKSLYVHTGDIITWICLAGCAVFLVFAIFNVKKY